MIWKSGRGIRRFEEFFGGADIRLRAWWDSADKNQEGSCLIGVAGDRSTRFRSFTSIADEIAFHRVVESHTKMGWNRFVDHHDEPLP